MYLSEMQSGMVYQSEICYWPWCNYLKWQLQPTMVVNYPNIGRNFLLSADHRVPHYPPTQPSKCDYKLQTSTHVITAPAAAGGVLVWCDYSFNTPTSV